MLCPNCGNMNNENSKFCIKCGKVLLNEIQTSEEQPTLQQMPSQTNTTQNINNPQIQNVTLNTDNKQTLQTNNNINLSNPENQATLNHIDSNNTNNNDEVLNKEQNNQNSINGIKKIINNKKAILIIGIALVLIIAIIIVLCFFDKKDNKVNMEELGLIFESTTPILIEKENKYGYISADGKVIVEPKYNTAENFVGDYAITFLNKGNSRYEGTYHIIDKKGNIKHTYECSYSCTTGKPTYNTTYDIWIIDERLYDGNLKALTSADISVSYQSDGFLTYTNTTENKSGILNSKGKKVFEWDGTSIILEISDNDESEDDKYANVSAYQSKEIIISLKTGKILYTVDDPVNKYISVEDDNIFEIIERSDYNTLSYLYFRDGKLAYENTNLKELELYDYKNQILKLDYGYRYDDLGYSNRYEYYDLKNKKVLKEQPNKSEQEEVDIDELSIIELYGYEIFSCYEGEGIFTGDKIVLSCEYDEVTRLNSDLYNYIKNKANKYLYILEKDDTVFLFDAKRRKNILKYKNAAMTSYQNSTFIKVTIYDKEDKVEKYIIYNILTNKKLELDANEYSKINISSNYITVIKDSKTIYYNASLKEIYIEN